MTKKRITVMFDLEANEGSAPTGEDVARYLRTIIGRLRDPKLDSLSLSNPTVYMEPPRVVVGMEGGINQGASAEIPVEIVTVDYDDEIDDLIAVPQPDGTVSEARVYGLAVDVDPTWVDAAYAAYTDPDKVQQLG
jgi:hypothetical protein